MEKIEGWSGVYGLYRNKGGVEAMNHIIYRKATVEDCYAIAELKGIVWHTTYKGIYDLWKTI